MKYVKELFLLFFVLISCTGTWEGWEEETPLPAPGDLTALEGKSFWFGHKSVGANIIRGMDEVLKKHSEVDFRLKETTDPGEISPGTLAHANIGENENPRSKMTGFLEAMKEVGDHVDFATFKFCFYDFGFDTDVEKVFEEYKETVALFKERYPQVNYFHITTPLYSPPGGIGSSVKRLVRGILGKPQWGYEDNIKRKQFNELLLAEYSLVDPVFDLARVESTTPGGKRYFLAKKGEKFNALLREYTTDGGHLNEMGRQVVAGQMLRFLASLQAVPGGMK